MTDIPLKAKIHCTDDSCGEAIAVVVRPDGRQVTHLVLEDKTLPSQATRIIPIEKVADSTPTDISLTLSKAETATLDPFLETRHVQVERPVPGVSPMAPYAGEPEMETVDVETQEEVIPEGEVALHRGSTVEASDGPVGEVEDLVVDAKTGAVNSLVLKEGHFWDKKVVTLPASTIDRIAFDTIYLNIDKGSIARLPEISLSDYQSGSASGSARGW